MNITLTEKQYWYVSNGIYATESETFYNATDTRFFTLGDGEHSALMYTGLDGELVALSEVEYTREGSTITFLMNGV